MKFRRTAAGATDTPLDARARRRGLGPFSGGQLTIITVTFAVLLLFPIGAWAVAGSNVFVTDFTSGKQATVNAAGQLATTDNAPTVIITSGSTSVGPNGSTLLFVNANVSAYHDVRFFVNQTGAQVNHQVINILAKAGAVNAILDQWTMVQNTETRRYETPGITMTGAAYNFNTVDTATYTWTLVGRPN
jgi:hypothetical protein